MSDPMTNTEVEDVLASIRRLVSDDTRAVPAAAAKPKSDRLVLTPALRVDDEAVKADEVEVEEEAPEAEVEAEAADDDFEADAFDDGDDAEGADSLTAFATVAFSKKPAEAPQVDSDEVEAEAEDDDAEADDIEAEDESDDHEEAPFDDAEEEDSSASVLVLHPEPSDAVRESLAEVLNDEAQTFEFAEAQDSPAPEDDDDTAQDAPAAEYAPEPPMPGSDERILPTLSLSEKIATLETLVGKRRDNFEPDDAGEDPYAGTRAPAMEWEDADDAPEYSAYADADTDDDERSAQKPQIFATDEDVLDEEALRELVSDIVREELQGALGERITRNVRKLVRREIHRALAAQELE